MQKVIVSKRLADGTWAEVEVEERVRQPPVDIRKILKDEHTLNRFVRIMRKNIGEEEEEEAKVADAAATEPAPSAEVTSIQYDAVNDDDAADDDDDDDEIPEMVVIQAAEGALGDSASVDLIIAEADADVDADAGRVEDFIKSEDQFVTVELGDS